MTTSPGYNKQHRDFAKLLLSGTSICLVARQGNIVAVILSALATVCVSRGKVESGKNLKWLTLSTISFVASLVAFTLLSGQEFIDADKAYEFKIKLLVYGNMIQTIWGGILLVFTISTFASEANEWEELETARRPKRH